MRRGAGPPCSSSSTCCSLVAGLRPLSLFDRRREMYAHIPTVPRINIIEHFETHGETLFHAIVDGDLAKCADAPYRASPHSAWLRSRTAPTPGRRRGVESGKTRKLKE
jgi:hypothetical protein